VIFLKDPDTSIDVPFNWSDAIAAGITVTSVAHVVPTGLVKVSEQTDTVNALSSVRVSGGTNPAMYVIEAKATLSSNEVVVKRAPVRCYAG
jgi:hypothetical protein